MDRQHQQETQVRITPMQEGFWKEAKNKELTRDQVLKQFQNTKPLVCLFLPGIDIACIKKIYDANLINQKMIFYIVERDEAIMLVIKQKIRKLSESFYHQCLFFTCELSQVKFKHNIDFSFMDLMGNLTADLANWLRNSYLPFCSSTNVTFYTLLKAYRNNNFMKKWQKFIELNFTDEFTKSLEDDIDDFDTEKIDFYKSIIPCTLYLFEGLYVETGFEFNFSEVFEYKDKKIDSRGIDMIFFHVKMLNVPVIKGNYPCIKDFNFGCQIRETVEMSKPENKTKLTLDERKFLERQIIAYKAVSTRYRNLGYPAKAAVATRQANHLSKQLG